MSLIRATSAILQGTLYTLGKINDQHYLWSGNDSPILQSGLCSQPDLFEYSDRLVAMCHTPFSTSFLTHKDGLWETDSALNRETPTLQDGASITKVGDQLILIGSGAKYQKTNAGFQFYNQSWNEIYSSEIQPELPPFKYHSATLANGYLIIISTEGIYRLDLTSKVWFKKSDKGFESGHSATYLDSPEPSIVIVDSSGLHLLNLNDFKISSQEVSGYKVKRTWHGASLVQGNLTIIFGFGAEPKYSKLSIHPGTWAASLQSMKMPIYEKTRSWGSVLGISIGIVGIGLIICGVLVFSLAFYLESARKPLNPLAEFDIIPQENLPPSVYPWNNYLTTTSSSSLSSEGTLT